MSAFVVYTAWVAGIFAIGHVVGYHRGRKASVEASS